MPERGVRRMARAHGLSASASGASSALTARPSDLADRLAAEWHANGERWEAVATKARTLGLDVWNPALYAGAHHRRFLERYPPKPGAILALGLNPGPYGMAQTGIPFTDCRTATRDLGLPLEIPGLAPPALAARLKKPNGRWRGTYERSSLGVYAFLRSAWGTLEHAYENWFVGNPCPLLFLDPKKWNVTPADARLRRIPEIRELRQVAVRRFHALLNSRAIVCFGKDVSDAVGDVAVELVGPDRVLRYVHPARAPPRSWSEGLAGELARQSLL